MGTGVYGFVEEGKDGRQEGTNNKNNANANAHLTEKTKKVKRKRGKLTPSHDNSEAKEARGACETSV